MAKKQDAKTLYTTRMSGLTFHKHRIKEEKKTIKLAKRAIKTHKLLMKQVKTQYKLSMLEQ